MLSNLNFEKGDIKDIVFDVNFDPVKKAFASLYCANHEDIIHCLHNFKKNLNSQDALKVNILLSLSYLLNNQRVNSVEVLNRIGPLHSNSLNGWLSEYFASIWQMLVLYLKNKPINTDLKLAEQQKLYFIGDSHLIGMAVSPLRFFSRFSYIPGLRYSILSSPQKNLKIEGIKNSFLFSYPYQKIVISIGEIDTRMAFYKAQENINFANEILINFKSNVNDSINLINSLKLKSQNIALIVPPLSKEVNSSDNFHNSSELICDMREYVKKYSIKMGFTSLDYPSYIQKDNSFNSPGYYIDHAHFLESVYFDLISNFNSCN